MSKPWLPLSFWRAFCPPLRHLADDREVIEVQRESFRSVFRGGIFIMAVAAGPGLAMGAFHYASRALSKTGMAVVFATLMIGYPLAVLALVRARMAAIARQQLTRRGYAVCVRCGYSLRGQQNAACPECGTAFDAGARRTPEEPIRCEILGVFTSPRTPDMIWVEIFVNAPPSTVEMGEFALGPYWNCARHVRYLTGDGSASVSVSAAPLGSESATTRALFGVSNEGGTTLVTPFGEMPLPTANGLPTRLGRLLGL